MAALDARWAEGHEVLKRFGRALRDQTAEKIEEAVAQAVAEVRAEERRGADGQAAAEDSDVADTNVLASGLAGYVRWRFRLRSSSGRGCNVALAS